MCATAESGAKHPPPGRGAHNAAKARYSSPMPTPSALNWKPIFLKALSEYPVVAHACGATGIERSTAYRARETDEEFAKAWDDAMEEAIDKAEQEAYRRGVHGWHEPVVDKGRISYVYKRNEDGTFEMALDKDGQPIPLTIRKHSDSLLQFVLKGRRRSSYGDKTELTGANGGPVAMVDDTKRAARIAALLELAKTRRDIG